MLKCPKCGLEQSYVTNSRSMDGGIRRRRECCRCGKRFTTWEMPKEVIEQLMRKEKTEK